MSFQFKSIVAITLLAASLQASAANIVLRTGVDSGGVTLGQNVSDPFWTISVRGSQFDPAEVVNSEVICCGMGTAGSQAAWISDFSVTAGSNSTGWGIFENATARRQFDMSGLDITTAVLSGIWRVADFRYGIYLNGNLIQANTADGGSAWGADQAFNLAAGSGFFLAGVNTLELRGQSGNSIWDGFWFDGTVTAREASTVPEPGTLALLGLGLAGLGLARRRKAN